MIEVACGEENAATGVLGCGASMKAQAAAVWHIADFGHITIEARRPSKAQGIVARRDEVVFVFEGGECCLEVAEVGDYFAFAVHGFVLGG